jgi:tetratricopeptide (TPR) repeat protein
MAIVRGHIDTVPASHSEGYGVLLLKSVCLFVQGRDVDGALAVLKKCKGQEEGTWLYNAAFLHAYKADLQGAIRRYRSAVKLRVEDSTLAQVEDFICWLLDQEPDKYQLYYCLGFLNWKAKGDTSQALRDFQSFLAAGDQHKFPRERQLAQEWVEEIRQAMDGSDLEKGKAQQRLPTDAEDGAVEG